MMKLCMMALIVWGAMLTTSAYGFENGNTTLKNNDSKRYDYIIKAACGRIITDDEPHQNNMVGYDCVIDYGEIDSHSQLSICKFGCTLKLMQTGQTISVQPGDTVVIDKGVLMIQ